MIKKFSLAIAVLIVLFVFSSCCSKSCTTKEKKRIAVCNSTTGKVVDMSGLDGCKFMILLEDSTYLNPMNLVEGYRKQNLLICFSFEYKPMMPSVCMKGKMIEIKEIKVLN